ncbi:MAG: bile acid:sodium symporter family protein [Hyphomonadaceae bacterium]
MDPAFVAFVNTGVVPIGLAAIMFSMGLSLSLSNFVEVVRNPRAVAGGLFGQMVLMPLAALAVITLFQLPPTMAMGLFILAICPAGTTSNAVTYAAKANVALAVVLTALSSIITVFTIPFLARWGLGQFGSQGSVPDLPILRTMQQLAQMTVLPMAVGMVLRRINPAFADRASVWLRPAALIVLIAVIAFSVFVSLELVLDNIVRAGPAAYVLNVVTMLLGVGVGAVLSLAPMDRLTLGIEVGIQNATMATFLSLTVLGDIALAITPTIYGVIMLLNALLLVRWFKWRRARAGATAP